MACNSCRRQLSLLTRRNGPVPADLYNVAKSAASAHQLAGRIATAPSSHEQRRYFRPTPFQSNIMKNARDVLGRAVQSSTEPYRVVAATKEIYEACSKQAMYKIDPVHIAADTIPKTEEGEHIGEGSTMWHKDFGLPPTFSTWSQVTMLNMYLIFARTRNLDRDAARSWQAQLVDHYFFDAEERMDVNHGITSRALRQRYLKDLFVQWRGIIAAYDEGLAKNDAVLASAVWRNVFKGREDVDVRSLAAIVSWMRLCLKMLDQMPDEGLYSRAASALRWPAKNEFAVVDKPTRELEGQLATPDQTPSAEASAV
ncbi:hypothetical protein F5Y18DRAFT_423849 [Xylariaceae sp. FL1019]|nr:hypothetical protein F5Y18DRAFT_423849 [Xylariaceae sp. FL1019]